MSQLLLTRIQPDQFTHLADLFQQTSDLMRELSHSPRIPSSQAYFWTDEWQVGERTVDNALEQGDYMEFETVEEALQHLHQPA